MGMVALNRYGLHIVSDLWDSEGEDEAVWWPRTFWVDPGGISGWAVVWFDPVTLSGQSRLVRGAKDEREGGSVRSVLAWQCGLVRGPENSQVDELLSIIEKYSGRGLSLGVEEFVPRQLNQSREFLSPVRLRAALEWATHRGIRNLGDRSAKMWRRGWIPQSPADAKTVVTDARLRLWDMFTEGPDHARDATRHALLYLRRLSLGGLAAVERLHGWDPEWEKATPVR